jgi:hypothetical protein
MHSTSWIQFSASNLYLRDTIEARRSALGTFPICCGDAWLAFEGRWGSRLAAVVMEGTFHHLFSSIKTLEQALRALEPA